jgi:hypothetical protein
MLSMQERFRNDFDCPVTGSLTNKLPTSASAFDVYIHMSDTFNYAREMAVEQISPANT